MSDVWSLSAGDIVKKSQPDKAIWIIRCISKKEPTHIPYDEIKNWVKRVYIDELYEELVDKRVQEVIDKIKKEKLDGINI